MPLTQRNSRFTFGDCTLIAEASGPFFLQVKLVRLQSGPLACVYQDEDRDQAQESEGSGVFRAFSGSVEAAGASESEALDTLDRTLLRLSAPPHLEHDPAEPERLEQSASHDTDHCPPGFESMPPPVDPGDGAPDTVRAPRPSSLPAPAFTRTR
ncbi:MAG TPA: hypothetical protein VJV79_26050 [Polyangiaceae bacterium]|nr:hypothetical protein [Polyangiaceae bacterium]